MFVVTCGGCPLFRNVPERLAVGTASSSSAILCPRKVSVFFKRHHLVTTGAELCTQGFTFTCHEDSESLRWAPGWWLPQTNSGSEWHSPKVFQSWSDSGWTQFFAKVLKEEKSAGSVSQNQIVLSTVDKIVETNGSYSPALGELGKVLGSALSCCGTAAFSYSRKACCLQ